MNIEMIWSKDMKRKFMASNGGVQKIYLIARYILVFKSYILVL